MKLTIINKGEANIDMRVAQLRNPTNIRRVEKLVICKLTITIIANIPKTTSSNPSILTYQISGLRLWQSNYKIIRISLKSFQKSNLFCFLCIYNEDDNVHKLKYSSNRIDRHDHHIIRRYERRAIPHANQAVQ